jgi:hypothetical protein
MRGIVTLAINERLKPSVNAPVTATYDEGNFVDVKKSVLGDFFDGDDLWYQLHNGHYIWSGGVDVRVDCADLSDQDREHFLISYRQVHPNGKPNLDTKIPPDSLYFTPVKLPADTENIRVNNLISGVFANAVMQSLTGLDVKRKHVFVYIHGYQLFSSLKLDLLSSFVLSYLTHPDNTIAKMLFMAWPGQGGPSRKTVDDRTIRAGQNFTAKGLFEPFKELSDKLKNQNKCLNLVVHSFGHQLLDGMLNHNSALKIPDKIFENIFLMAPDVSHVTVKENGKVLRNYYKDKDGQDYLYKYAGLRNLANKVHVFYDKYDYLLYSSTKKFVEKGDLKDAKTREARLAITADYRNLGNYGNTEIDNSERLVPDFNYIDVDKLFAGAPPTDLSDFPFREIRNNQRNNVDSVWTDADYDGINAGGIIFNMKRFPDHHRYLFTCKPVIDEVLRILK